MNTIRDKVGNTHLLIAVEDDVTVVGESKEGRQTKPTGLHDRIQHAYNEARTLILTIASDFATDLENLHHAHPPTGLELEFSLAFSAEAAAWVLTGKGETALKVKLTWENPRHDDG